ncbi:hypothetical protein N8813_04905 [bacterium]|nr:hypothetical protein [bacterium]
MFTKDIDKTIQKITGRTIAKVVHGMWNKGYFDRFEEFQTSDAKNQNQQRPEAKAA